MNQRNYQKEMEKIIEKNEQEKRYHPCFCTAVVLPAPVMF